MKPSTGLRNVRRSIGFVLLAAYMVTGSIGCGAGGPDEVLPPSTEGAEVAAAEALHRIATGEGVRLVDLTHELAPDSIYWPTGSAFVHERLAWGPNTDGDWYASAAFSSPEHLGTHLDAPIHFSEQGWTSAEIPVGRFLAPGVVIDIGARAESDADATLEPSDIEAWEAAHGELPADAVVIVRTGWATRWPDWERYYGSATPKDVATLHFPGVSEAAAAMLVERHVAGVGIDTASIDPGISTRFEAHRVLGQANLFNLENLTNVGELPASGFVIVALPMKIAGGTGGPARVVAVVPGP